MNTRVMLYATLIIIGTFISSVAQVMLKKAAMKEYDSSIKEYINPTVIFAYAIFFGSTFLSVLAYKVVPLSMGPILEASSYLYITFFGVTIFKETINKKKVLALALIFFGIVIYALCG